jgi:hypothetical protein
MTKTSTRWLSGTALSATLAASLATGTLLVPRAAQADEQTVKLIQLLIQKGILSPGQAKDLLKETAPGKAHAHAAAPVEGLVPESEVPTTSGQIRVTYVPQFIRKQIADEVRAQVMDQAQQEGWAQPDALPEWTKRFKLYGDLRMRYEGDFYNNNNYNQFVNFNSINNGSAFDATSYAAGTAAPPPFLNTTEDRNRFRLRARIGVEADIDDWVTANIRIGTGQDDGPVSPNETLGNANAANGASGDFAKPSLWLDRAYFKLTPLPNLEVYAGRMNNPFLPSDLMFYPELGFDGFAAKYAHTVLPGVTLFGTVGAFPLFNTAFDFSTNSDVKYSSTDSYMTALQAGVRWDITSQYRATLGVGIFDFLGVQGSVSKPCFVQPGNAFYCNTDDTKAPFLQFGNTVYAIRDIQPETGLTSANSPDPEYYGLASRFNVLDVHPRFDILTWHPIDVALEAEYIKNLAYNRSEILNHGPTTGPVGPQNNLGNNGYYQGGDTGWMVKVALGQLEIQKRWDWSAFVSYRYLESDATLDAIDDSDFHLGGTNARGYLLGTSVGIARNTWLQLRYLSSQTVSGEPYGVSSIYLDLNSRF